MKKKYIIENSLLFNEETQELSIHGEQENTLVLPAPSSRLLSELINNNGTIVPREALLTRVWEDYGYRASNSNLNNYLSILRRNLSTLLPQSTLITTLPKQGFLFQANIEVESKCCALADCSEEKTAMALVMSNNSARPTLAIGIGRNRLNMLRLFTAFLGGGSLLAVALWQMQTISLPPMAERYIFSLNQCRFYRMQDTSLSQSEVLSTLKRFDTTLNCEQYPRDVFFTQYEEPGKRRHMAFIAWCQRAEGGKYTRCENSKIVSWGNV